MTEPVTPIVADRVMNSLRAIIRGELPQYDYAFPYEYVVQATDGVTIDCDPTDTSIPLPHLAQVPLRSSILGATSTPKIGGRAIIVFLNGDPSRPACISCDGVPTAATVSSSGTLTLGGGNMPTTEHVATVEGVVTMLVSLLYTMVSLGPSSTWTGVGKIFDPTDPSLTLLSTTITNMLAACNTPLIPTSATMGGVMLPAMLLGVEAQLAAKLPDVVPGLTPTGIGAPSVKTG